MSLGWFVVPYKRRNPGAVPAERYPSIDDLTAQILADGGAWDETEILGDKALVKVRASDATLVLVGNIPGTFTIPTRFFRLEDSFADLTAGERNQIQNGILSLGYTQAEVDAAMGSTLALWRAKTLDDLLSLATTRRLRPRYDQPSDTVVCDGPVQPVKSHRICAATVV